MSAPRRFGGLLFLAPVVLALAFFWHYRALWQTPSDRLLADMPEEEFADNDSLTMLPALEPLDTELTAQAYLDLLEQMREPESLLWKGSSRSLRALPAAAFTPPTEKTARTFPASCSNTARCGAACAGRRAL